MYFKKEDVITETLCFSYIPVDPDKNPLNIAFGTDKNFLFGCAIAITSILIKNPKQQLAFHIFTDTLNEDSRKRFQALAEQYHTTITLYKVNCEWLKRLPSTKNWSYAIYFRFLVTDYFYQQLDKIIYLDSDIVCNGSLQELTTLNIGENIVAAVAEGESSWWEKCAQRLETPSIKNGYFNSGFLLINIANWHKHDVTTKTMAMLSDPQIANRISYPDQDILNMLLPGYIQFLDKKYNTQFSLNYELKCKTGEAYPHPITESTVFIHYIGPTKPWHEWAVYPSSSYFYSAKESSPWKDVPLEKATSANQLRYSAKHEMHKIKILKSIKHYILYFIKKINRE
ncbi:lipopolysaccharide 3-alpha-galactosyltransferase [Pectobacterium quasiaquaticum]|uniref:lipopolysaccharide 3-alpha-galactosyltransferase n=1 Tax=Pectobacterium quasiaquaticum TaxID=2774015 RepID=UPI00187391A5|nr:lipopolysaccharide 3-alpha-galactosyltransferase [Pectobacterium quasiaquaticum]MBE5212881.1 lipopolysaccharide 3-alpha-galactosyltransferase [Pectobacterium quasiaquaticum]MBE5227060.1 lipopolysaccharide 3-alpha-galactosyltransferase [Pectobacterium quasiaquaticum]URG52620.1 lipopolysaccharide 3-alpha-galactosyltransferase [Pectobacterium quasiaquaticum]